MPRAHLHLAPCAVLLGLLAVVASAEPRLPATLSVTVLFKALTHDYNLTTRSSKGLRVGVVALQGDSDSDEVSTAVHGAIAQFATKRVGGL